MRSRIKEKKLDIIENENEKLAAFMEPYIFVKNKMNIFNNNKKIRISDNKKIQQKEFKHFKRNQYPYFLIKNPINASEKIEP